MWWIIGGLAALDLLLVIAMCRIAAMADDLSDEWRERK